MKNFKNWLRSFAPEPIRINQTERVRASLGALTGILLTGLLTPLMVHSPVSQMMLIAPMGASAVLLFAVPSSPLAQPWSILGGNILSAIIGITCAMLVKELVWAAALAVGISIAAMLALRCLHPPSGAVALTAVLGGPAIHAMGYSFVLFPVAINSVLILLVAILFNNLTRRPYPHPKPSAAENHLTGDLPPEQRFGFTSEDLNDVLKQYNQVLDVSRDDLQSLFHKTEMHAYTRRFGEILCADIMSKDVKEVVFGTLIEDAWTLLRKHHIKALPVIDRSRRLSGIVTQIDFMKHANLDAYEGIESKIRRFVRKTNTSHSEKPEVVGQIMTSSVISASTRMPITELIPLMSEHGVHHVPIVDDERRLVGIVTQSDLIAALYRGRLNDVSA